MALRPQDVLIALKLAAHEERSWTYPELAQETGVSLSETHASIQRLKSVQLFQGSPADPVIDRRSLYLFLLHGLRLVFPSTRGALTRGMPTSHAAPPLNRSLRGSKEPPPVWPMATGSVRGYALEPLYRTVPAAAQSDPRLYELLALVDAIRDGTIRERNIAAQELAERLGVPLAQTALQAT